MKNIVRINIDTKMNDLNLDIENKNIVNILNKVSNKNGKNNIRHLYSWTHNSNIIKCYGWYDGKNDTINKHELIPNGSSKFLEEDSSIILLYGDIFLLCYDKNNKNIDFSVSDYAEFYEIINEGFDDCLSEDDEEEDSEEDDDDEQDYIDELNKEDIDELNKEDMDEDFEIINDENDELDIDNNNY